MSRLPDMLRGQGLAARAMRSSTFTVLGYGGSQMLRLASNLILTRLLFPEAFGMMALVQVFLTGLMMFSDLGISPAILQSKRGDERDFLNTAWTIQVLRGFGLWIAASLLAFPIAAIYGAPELAQLLPVAAFALVITGFSPTRLETANRHLALGRVTLIDLVTQVTGIAAAVVLALIWQSVWALIWSGLISAVVQLILYQRLLPGIRNRFRWEKAAAAELIRFGKWIFLSTVAGFLYYQGDKLILGRFLTLDLLGIYNIGYFLASFPLLLGAALTRKIMIPLYRERPPAASRENFAKLRRLRLVISFGLVSLLILLALGGDALIALLYDDRYRQAGGIVVLVAAFQILPVIVLTYDQAALAAGDSRRFFLLSLVRAGLMILALLAGVSLAGLLGALIGQGLAMLLAYPVAAWLARKQGAWDGLHDAGLALYGLLGAAVAVWYNWAAVSALV
jgi:O-antigen/teichoic acid export membrane protein